MDPQLADLLRELEDSCRHNGGTPRIAREAGQFLNILIKAMKAATVLQVGVSDGYLTLWLADAVTGIDGQVIVVESDVVHFDTAKEVFDRAPVSERIQLFQGEVAELLPVLEGPFDLVVFDAEPASALPYFHLLFDQIRSNALLCCEKAISNAGALSEYLAYMHDRPGLESILVPIGEGIELTYKVP
jgi:predicted O-methyltransferase YrrM